MSMQYVFSKTRQSCRINIELHLIRSVCVSANYKSKICSTFIGETQNVECAESTVVCASASNKFIFQISKLIYHLSMLMSNIKKPLRCLFMNK